MAEEVQAVRATTSEHSPYASYRSGLTQRESLLLCTLLDFDRTVSNTAARTFSKLPRSRSAYLRLQQRASEDESERTFLYSSMLFVFLGRPWMQANSTSSKTSSPPVRQTSKAMPSDITSYDFCVSVSSSEDCVTAVSLSVIPKRVLRRVGEFLDSPKAPINERPAVSLFPSFKSVEIPILICKRRREKAASL